MKKFIAALALFTAIAIPMLSTSVSAATMSPSSSDFGSNGYWSSGVFNQQLSFDWVSDRSVRLPAAPAPRLVGARAAGSALELSMREDISIKARVHGWGCPLPGGT
jgi:hypothetical protein